MLILVNLTGLTKWYLIPKIKFRKYEDSWCFEFTFLQVQFIILNNTVASDLFSIINEKYPNSIKRS